MSTLRETAVAGQTRAASASGNHRGTVRTWIRQPDVRAAFTATVALRLFTSAFAAFIVSMLHATFISVSVQADMQGQAAGLTIVPTSLHGVAQFLTTPWVRWDADVYVKIAEHGYAWYGSTAFMPLYPALVHIGGLGLGGHYVLASLIISTVASFFMFLYLYRLVARVTGSARVSRYTLAVACLLPVAFFLMAPYTESLFLALAFAATLDSLDGRWGRAACYAVIASVTRQQGVLLSLLAVPALWGAVTYARRLDLPLREHAAVAWRQARRPLLLVAAAVGAYAVWIVCLTVIAGAPAPWQVLTSSHGWRQHFEIPGVGVFNDIRTIVQNPGNTLAHKMSLPL
ncbi:MAG: mannosyltransferase family protein, partial [Ktedonobacterales bacterium]